MEFRSAVVTGAASGIGRALATRLASVGTRLVLADVQIAALTNVAEELQATAVPTDVGDDRAVEALAAAAPDAELVCLNAGIVGSALGTPWEAALHEWDRVLRVNLGGWSTGCARLCPGWWRRVDPATS